MGVGQTQSKWLSDGSTAEAGVQVRTGGTVVPLRLAARPGSSAACCRRLVLAVRAGVWEWKQTGAGRHAALPETAHCSLYCAPAKHPLDLPPCSRPLLDLDKLQHRALASIR